MKHKQKLVPSALKDAIQNFDYSNGLINDEGGVEKRKIENLHFEKTEQKNHFL